MQNVPTNMFANYLAADATRQSFPSTAVYFQMMAATSKYGMAVGGAYASICTEWLSFINRRLQKDLELPSRLSSCQTSAQLMSEWSKFLDSAAEDYRTEISRMGELGSTASGAALSALQASYPIAGGSDPHQSTVAMQ